MSTATRNRKRRTKLDDMSRAAVVILRDKIQDDTGRDLLDWLSPADFEPYYFVPEQDEPGRGRNVAFWAVASGGRVPCLAYLRTEKAELHRAFAELVAPRWAIRAGHVFGWHPLPMFPYRLLWRVLDEFGVVDPDSYIKTGAHRLARQDRDILGLTACGPKHKPFVTGNFTRCCTEFIGRGYRTTAKDYKAVTEIVGWENRHMLRIRVRDIEYGTLSTKPCPKCYSGRTSGQPYSTCERCQGYGTIPKADSEF